MASLASRERLSFSKLREVLQLPDLIAVQRESFLWFLEQGVAEVLSDISPIEDFTGQLKLELSDHIFDPPKYSEDECRERDMTYPRPLFVTARFMNAGTGEIKEQTVFMGDFPMMTDRGTFIINGTERIVVSQLVRSPGVYFGINPDKTSPEKDVVDAKMIPGRGAWLEFEVDKKDIVYVRIDRKRKQPVTVLLKALGFGDTNEELAHLITDSQGNPYQSMLNTLEKDHTEDADAAFIDIYRKLRPGEPPTPDSARALLENLFFNPKRYDMAKVGRHKVSKKLRDEYAKLPLKKYDLTIPNADPEAGPVDYQLSKADILATVSYIVKLHNNDADYYPRRHRPLRQPPRALGRRAHPEPGARRPLAHGAGRARAHDHPGRRGDHAADPDQHPPGGGGDQGVLRLQPAQPVHGPDQPAGRPHPQAPPLGPRAGWSVASSAPGSRCETCTRATTAACARSRRRKARTSASSATSPATPRINRFGFIETPYRRIKNGVALDEVEYLAADDEDRYVIAQANANIDDKGRFLDDRVLVRAGRGELAFVDPHEVDYMDVSPKQIVSVATALIPFLEHDDANRALMGANMQRQAVPLLRATAPFIGTGVEGRAARDAGEVILAKGNGTVVDVTGDTVVVDYEGQRGSTTHRLSKFRRSNQGTCINQKPRVDIGSTVREGEVIADGPSTHEGELALGKNLLVAFMPWKGHNYEDAIVISERLVKDDVLTSIHIEEHEIDARDTKLGAEEITRDIPNLSEDILKDLDERGIIRIGAEVGPGDILVGKVTPKGETELTPEERLLRAIFGEKAREVRDTSLKVPHGETGKVIDVRVFSREEGHELPPGVNQLVRVYVGQKRKISEGDKLAGRHGNKGVISKILPVEDMPYLADGTPVDIVLNPLGVPSRMNVGQVLEAHLGYAARHGWEGTRDGAAGAQEDAHRHRARGVGVHAGVRRRPLGRGRAVGRAGHDPAPVRDHAPRRRGQPRAAPTASSASTARPRSTTAAPVRPTTAR